MARFTKCRDRECNNLVAEAHKPGRTGYCRSCSTKRGFMRGRPGLVHTAEAKRRISEANKGRTLTQAHKEAISCAHRGNKYKVGIKPWNYGRAHSEATRKKLKLAARNRPPVSEETRQKQSATRKRNPSRYWLGKKQPRDAVAKRSGPNHPCWRGGITPVNSLIRNLPEYHKWRKEVFRRDNYACQIGGRQHRGDLNADHIKPFAVILREQRISTVAAAHSCKELWDTSNGRTLCIPCHKSTDTFAGKAHKQLQNT